MTKNEQPDVTIATGVQRSNSLSRYVTHYAVILLDQAILVHLFARSHYPAVCLPTSRQTGQDGSFGSRAMGGYLGGGCHRYAAGAAAARGEVCHVPGLA